MNFSASQFYFANFFRTLVVVHGPLVCVSPCRWPRGCGKVFPPLVACEDWLFTCPFFPLLFDRREGIYSEPFSMSDNPLDIILNALSNAIAEALMSRDQRLELLSAALDQLLNRVEERRAAYGDAVAERWPGGGGPRLRADMLVA